MIQPTKHNFTWKQLIRENARKPLILIIPLILI